MTVVGEPGLNSNPRERVCGCRQRFHCSLQPKIVDVPHWRHAKPATELSRKIDAVHADHFTDLLDTNRLAEPPMQQRAGMRNRWRRRSCGRNATRTRDIDESNDADRSNPQELGNTRYRARGHTSATSWTRRIANVPKPRDVLEIRANQHEANRNRWFWSAS